MKPRTIKLAVLLGIILALLMAYCENTKDDDAAEKPQQNSISFSHPTLPFHIDLA
ncbi:hypothetical protein [Robertkochia flava]|uniref:hypothetical protein n=1 Tax=Robertkochia flava TaxID=3447986 RepID=UPI001CC96304|nr:hypothetical protein [Robertkochia marina]